MKKKNIFSGQAAPYIKRGALALVSLTMLSTTLYASATTEILPKETGVKEALQDQRTVQGVVTDDLGEPLIGVTVKVVGTTTGTITDLDGNFSIPVTGSNASLEFSYVGHITQTIKTGDKSDFNIVLETDSKMLDQVVVTALGMKRSEKALGYAVTEVRGEDLKRANSISPVAALQGKVAGVEISQSDGGMFGAAKIQIRGASTLQGNNQPIYVIDGVILDNSVSGSDDLNWTANPSDYGNELKNLNPDDFETVSVLKGAAATALYGSRGLNGAVVITTKSGQGGQGYGVSLSQTLGWDVITDYPEVQNEYGYGLYTGRRDAYGNKWDPNLLHQNEVTVNGKKQMMDSYRNAASQTFAFGPKFDGRQMENYDGSMTTYSPYKNAMKEFYQTGFNTNTNLSIRGGNDKTTFYSSLSYKNAESTTRNNTFERYSFLIKGTHKISDRLDVAASVNFAHSKPKNAAKEVGLSFVTGIPNSANPAEWRDKYKGEHGGQASNDYSDLYGPVPPGIKSMWWGIDNNSQSYREYVIRPTFEFNYKMTDWVSFKGEANMNIYTLDYENKELGSGYGMEGGKYQLTKTSKEQFTTAGTFTFNKNLGDFNLGGFARGEFYNKREESMDAYTAGGLIVPGQFFLENSKNTQGSTAKIFGTKRMLSAVFAVNTSWKDQVYLDVTGRNDWSSALVYTNGTGTYSYFYPSVSGSWLANNTIEMPEWVTLAKLRASWAQVGSDTNPYAINQGFNQGRIITSDGYIYTNSFSSDNIMIDKNLKPQRKNAWEVGLDLRFVDSRIGFDITYYKENTKDQILDIDVPSISGISKRKINAGNIENSGIEIALNTIPFRNKDWEVGVDLTFTKNKNKIVELHPDVADYVKLQGEPTLYDFRVGSVAKVGGSYGLLMSDIMPAKDANGNTILKWDDTYRAAYADRDGTVKEVGDMTPDFLSSLSTNVKWKSLNLRVAFDARVGGTVASFGSRYGSYRGYTETSLAYRDASRGGASWESKWLNSDGSKSGSYGIQYTDGVIPEGVFAAGTEITTVDGSKKNVGGMSYAELVDRGWIEPMHAGAYHFYRNDWTTGTINDDWVHKLSYVALREISLSYTFDRHIASKIGARGLSCSFTGRNLGYLYNSLPNNVHPESVRGNRAGEFRIRSYNPYTASFAFGVNVDF